MSKKRNPTEGATKAAGLLEARARIGELPADLQPHVRAAFSDLIAFRVSLLEYWRQVPRKLRRGEAVKIAKGWVRKARLLAPLYPCLARTYPMPCVLDGIVAVLEQGTDPGELASLVLDLEHLQLDEQTLTTLRSQEATR